LHELVVGQVVVERADDPVAIAPGVGADFVVLESIALREAREVQPVLGPMFAIAVSDKQAIDDFLVGVRGGVVCEGVDLGGRWRQPDEVKMNSSNQCFA
jgi:hypothetical protein